MRGTHNILVISDLHLGEDLNPSSTEETSRGLELAERQLVEFLNRYTRRRTDGLPWRLVINGDMIDFLSICVFPDQVGQVEQVGPVEHSRDEREYGLARCKEAAFIQVDAVVERHGDFFAALARFLAAGNAVEITGGNHDTELYWPEVKERLRAGVVRTWLGLPDARRPGAATGEQIGQAIRFHNWFYHEPGLVWIEHGHQYDECCSFEYNLYPVDMRGQALVPNIDTAAMRYVTNQIPEAPPHGVEEWSFGGYLRFALGLGRRSAWRLGRGYFFFALTLLREWQRARISRSRRMRRAIHERELTALSEQSGVPGETLRLLDAMQRPPVITNLRRLLQVLMLDKVLVTLGIFLVALVALLWLPLVGGVAVAAAGLAGSRLAYRWLDRGRTVDAALPLQIVPARVVEHIDARYVVFGHTHIPVAQPLARAGKGDEPRWYYNTGTWVSSGRPGLLRAFTHLVIRHGKDGPIAALCQWRDGASRQFTPGWTSLDVLPREEPARKRARTDIPRAA